MSLHLIQLSTTTNVIHLSRHDGLSVRRRTRYFSEIPAEIKYFRGISVWRRVTKTVGNLSDHLDFRGFIQADTLKSGFADAQMMF
jgi:hypothetical protein